MQPLVCLVSHLCLSVSRPEPKMSLQVSQEAFCNTSQVCKRRACMVRSYLTWPMSLQGRPGDCGHCAVGFLRGLHNVCNACGPAAIRDVTHGARIADLDKM